MLTELTWWLATCHGFSFQQTPKPTTALAALQPVENAQTTGMHLVSREWRRWTSIRIFFCGCSRRRDDDTLFDQNTVSGCLRSCKPCLYITWTLASHLSHFPVFDTAHRSGEDDDYYTEYLCITFMADTMIFEPMCLADRAANTIISSIIIGAFEPTTASISGRAKATATSSALTNRWVIHLVEDERNSIRVAPLPSGAAPITISFTSFEHGIPADLIRTYKLPVRAGFHLGAFIDVIERGRFRQYDFHESGHGCRYFILVLLGFLTENGIVLSPTSLHGARVCLQQVWLKGGILADEDQQTHLVPGRFLDED